MFRIAQVFTVKEAATAARVSTATIRRLIAAGKLPAFRVGRSIRIDRAALLATRAKGETGVSRG